MKTLLLYLLTVNALGFLLMLVDKRRAKKKLWRIPEFTLMSVAAFGGSFGSYAGMKLFHHKTRHRKFRIGIPVMMVIHILILYDLMDLGILRRL